jgi:hypothetical protein
MTMHYKIVEVEGKPSTIWADLGDGQVLSIPMDEANSDYQAYLLWLENPEAEQSTPNLPN